MKAPDDQESILARFMRGPALLEHALTGIRDSELDAPPSQGGWTIRQIVHHVVDGDDLWKTCIKAALGNAPTEFSFDWYWTQPQDVWAQNWGYESRPLDVSLALLKASRDHVHQLLRHVPYGWHRTIGFRRSNGEVEPLPVGAAVEIQAEHVEHHVKRILAIRAELAGT